MKAAKDGALLPVKLTPKSSADRVDGLEQTSDGKTLLKARVRAVPEDGKANTALIKTLSKWLGVPKSQLSLATGAKSRHKTVHIRGDMCDIESQLKSALERDGHG
ncbi:MAG: DUF167 domain-containing protein [Sphingomonadales bacterium]|nr:DUF167 domain-containing protein [Sphingomonadales bacterium]